MRTSKNYIFLKFGRLKQRIKSTIKQFEAEPKSHGPYFLFPSTPTLILLNMNQTQNQINLS